MTNDRPIQLELPLNLDLPEKQYWQLYRTPEQESKFQSFLVDLRNETAEMLALANQLMPEQKFANLTELTTPQLAQVSSAYFRVPEQEPTPQEFSKSAKVSKPPKPYQPWSNERKFRTRIARLSARVEKNFSIPEMRIAKLLDLCAENPQYLGLCLLPGTTDRCHVRFNIVQAAAIERETMLRKLENQNN